MEVSKKGELRSFELDAMVLKKGALMLRAVNHKLRQQFIKYINEKEELTVTELYVKFRLEQSVASQQLAILRQSGFVNTRRDGKYIYYSINHNRLKEVHELSRQLAQK